MTALLEPVLMDAPEPQGVKGTLLDIATPVTGRLQWLNPTGLYTSFNCVAVGTSTDICSPGSKSFSSPAVIDGFQFSVYAGFKCKSVGLDWSEVQAGIERASENREAIAVEEQFMASAAFQGATDITPAASPNQQTGLALLEADMAAKYGVGVIHMPRVLAALLLMTGEGALRYDGRKLVTALGTPVAAGGGYDISNKGPGGNVPAAGKYWMWATGQVQLGRSAWTVPGPQIEKSTNDMTVLVERSYIGSVDCYASAVKVTLT